jgi:hypothetical protein
MSRTASGETKMMACGEVLMAGSSGVHSPWFERFGDTATFFGQVIAIRDAVLTIEIQTKNRDEPDSAATALGSIEMTAVGVDSTRVTSMRELVRFEYAVSNVGLVPPEANYAHFRMLPPAWEGDVLPGAAAPQDGTNSPNKATE